MSAALQIDPHYVLGLCERPDTEALKVTREQADAQDVGAGGRIYLKIELW